MKLIILYGSEASGKLTVAKALATKTTLSLFHNHLSVDVAKALYPYRDPRYEELLWQIRLLVLESAARNRLPGLVYTWAYSHPDFLPLLDRIYAKLDDYPVQYHFVHLTCSQSTLEQRVVQEDRVAAGKISSVSGLHQQQARKNHVVIPGTDSLVIDNTSLSPNQASDLIIRHFGLSGVPSHD